MIHKRKVGNASLLRSRVWEVLGKAEKPQPAQTAFLWLASGVYLLLSVDHSSAWSPPLLSAPLPWFLSSTPLPLPPPTLYLISLDSSVPLM